MRSLTLEDVAFVRELQNDALIMRYHFKGARYDDETIIEEKLPVWMRIFDERGYGFYLIFEKGKPENEGFVGKSALWKVDELSNDQDGDQLDVAWLLLERHRGKGYATEVGRGLVRYAFNGLGKKSLVALIEPDNEASKHVADRLGFVYEETRVLPSRGDADTEIYRLKREDYKMSVET